MAPRFFALVAVAVLSAGCGQAATTPGATTPKPKTSVALIASSAAATAGARSARMAQTTTMTGFTGSSKPLRSTGSGVVDFEHGNALLDFHESTPQGMKVRVTERMIGGVVYLYSPVYALPKPWLRIDPKPANTGAGLNLNDAMSAGGNGPAGMLGFLDAASDSVRTVGVEDVRGTPTTHYHVVFDLRKLAGRASAAHREERLRRYRKQIEFLGTNRMPIDVWIDADGLVRREHFELSPRRPSAETPARVVMTVDLFDFGVPVHVVAPPAGSVVDSADVAVPS